MSIAPTTNRIVYPSSDGQPMAETGIHVRAIMLLHQALEDYFRDRPDVFIASDMFWYWEEGNPSACISPDVMVVPEVQPRDLRERRSFFTWEEGGAVPAIVFEMASENTWRNDLEGKFNRYEELGVQEYFLFDPEGLYLVPVLQGYRLRGSAYRRIPTDALESQFGFKLQPEGMAIRLIDSRTGQPIPTRAEAANAARAWAQEEQQRADSEKQRADSEKQRADGLAAEIERLKKLLGGAVP